VLWRLNHGNIDGISPKLAVVMIGTNNTSNGYPPEQVVEGVAAIVKKLRTKLSKTKILVLAIFPHDAHPQDRMRQLIVKVNEGIARLADDKMVFFLDIGPKFLAADGTLTQDVMPDLLHPSAKGYTIWAKAIEPTVAKLMDEKSNSVLSHRFWQPDRYGRMFLVILLTPPTTTSIDVSLS
jgi:beta-glucosidase